MLQLMKKKKVYMINPLDNKDNQLINNQPEITNPRLSYSEIPYYLISSVFNTISDSFYALLSLGNSLYQLVASKRDDDIKMIARASFRHKNDLEITTKNEKINPSNITDSRLRDFLTNETFFIKSAEVLISYRKSLLEKNPNDVFLKSFCSNVDKDLNKFRDFEKVIKDIKDDTKATPAQKIEKLAKLYLNQDSNLFSEYCDSLAKLQNIEDIYHFEGYYTPTDDPIKNNPIIFTQRLMRHSMTLEDLLLSYEGPLKETIKNAISAIKNMAQKVNSQVVKTNPLISKLKTAFLFSNQLSGGKDIELNKKDEYRTFIKKTLTETINSQEKILIAKFLRLYEKDPSMVNAKKEDKELKKAIDEFLRESESIKMDQFQKELKERLTNKQ